MKTLSEIFLEKYILNNEDAKPLDHYVSTQPIRKSMSDSYLISSLNRVILRGLAHQDELPSISRVTCNTSDSTTIVTLNIITTESTEQDITVSLPNVLLDLFGASDPHAIIYKFITDVIKSAAKELT